MGDRRIRHCKSCGRRFTPKNQKTIEGPADVAAGTVKTVEAPQEAPAPTCPQLAALLPGPSNEPVL